MNNFLAGLPNTRDKRFFFQVSLYLEAISQFPPVVAVIIVAPVVVVVVVIAAGIVVVIFYSAIM